MEKESLANAVTSNGTKVNISCWNQAGLLKCRAAEAFPRKGDLRRHPRGSNGHDAAA